MTKLRTLFVAAFTLLLTLAAAPAQAATVVGPPTVPVGSTVVRAYYTTSNDTPAYADVPVGKVVFWTPPNAPIVNGSSQINYKLRLSGLLPGRTYFPVPYRDPFCAPLPGVSAYPASTFVAAADGTAYAVGTVNPRALNPLGTYSLKSTNSVSLRLVAASVNNPIPGNAPYPPPVINAPNPVTSSCVTDERVFTKKG